MARPAAVVTVALLLCLTAPAATAATRPPDPLRTAYGAPTATYAKRAGRYLLYCQLWLYTRHGLRAMTIERCVTYGLAHPNPPRPRPTGPAS